jgi:hypothetical protein
MAYITAANAKAQQSSLADFTDAEVNAAVAEFQDICERYCGRKFGTRSATFEVGTRPLPANLALPDTDISSVSATVDGTSVSMSNVTINEDAGTLRNMPWAGTYPTTALVAYTVGTSAVPAVLASGAAEYAARTLNSRASGTSRDVRWQSPDGAVSFVTPSWRDGRPTGYTDVDRALNTYKSRMGQFA